MGGRHLIPSLNIGLPDPQSQLPGVVWSLSDFNGSAFPAPTEVFSAGYPNSLCYSGTDFVACGLYQDVDYDTYAATAISIDGGLSWEVHVLPQLNTRFTSITYGNGLYVGVILVPDTSPLTSHRVGHSTDGINWTFLPKDALLDHPLVQFSNGYFFLLGPKDTIVFSTDGVTWNQVSTGTVNIVHSTVTYGVNSWVFAGQVSIDDWDELHSSETIAITSDLTTVVRINTPDMGATRWQSIAFADTMFLVSGTGEDAQTLARSYDGIAWTMATEANLSAPQRGPWEAYTGGHWPGTLVSSSIAYGLGTWVMTAQSGLWEFYTSPDGVNWTGRKSASSAQTTSLVFGSGNFVAVVGNVVARSH